MEIIDNDDKPENTVPKILSNEDEISIIHSDFEREEMGIIKILSQCNSYIIHRLTDYRDLEIVKNLVGANARELVEFVPILEKQHALVVGEAFTMPEIVKINPAPLPKSNDPKVIESWRKE